MKFQTIHDQPDQPDQQEVACVVVGIFHDNELSEHASQIDTVSQGFLSEMLAMGDLGDKAGNTMVLYKVPDVKAERVLLVNCGKKEKFNVAAFHKVVNGALAALKNHDLDEVSFYLQLLEVEKYDIHWKIRQVIELAVSAEYQFEQLKSEPEEASKVINTLSFAYAEADADRAEKAINEGQAIANGVALAKDLANLPGNICTPSYLADQALQLEKNAENLQVKVLEEAEMKALGMGALLSVSSGSREPAKLIVLEYHGGDESQKPIVLVGKGLTFDAGGISLKPSVGMDEMKYDMCGGASVLGVMKALAELRSPINVTGVIPSSENLPDGAANKPGDIVTSMSGQTIEVLNTDAEGRLILCDALTFSAKFNPDVVIDIATLTGACVVALGKHPSGLLSNDATLTQGLIAAGEYSRDRVWQLPLWDEYQEQLDSNFADMANIGGKEAGTITAACFLSKYTEDYQWAHLDIAGTAWKSGKDKGATGRPVSLLMQYIIDRSQ